MTPVNRPFILAQDLPNFQKFEVLAFSTTSELMTTWVDAQPCQVFVLDANIASMTKFKQIIGRGTRINEEYLFPQFLKKKKYWPKFSYH